MSLLTPARTERSPGAEQPQRAARPTPAGRLSRIVVPAVVPARWLLVLAGVAFVLASSYANLTHWRTGWANGVAGPLVQGDRLGQSFVARYDNLSGVEVWLGTYGRGASPSRATLVLHLKDSPSAPADLRTAVLPPDRPVGENSRYTFWFPPVSGSQNRSYYIEIESPDGRPDNALTVYWWQSDPEVPTDPYPYGTAYRGGQPIAADLAFGLHYTPAPISAFAQMARAASENFPPLMMLVLSVGGAALVLWACRRAPGFATRRQQMQIWAPAFVLLVALTNGLAYLLLMPPWQGPDEHGHFTYAALLDRYGMDDNRVQALQWWEGGADRDVVLQIKNAVWASMQEHRWTYGLIGYPAPGASTPPLGSSPEQSDFVWQIRQPATYYWLSVLAVRAAQAVGLAGGFQSTPASALLVMRGLSLVLMLGVVALGWVAGRWLWPSGGTPGKRAWGALLLPLTLALLPMHAFIGTSADNDILAELAWSAIFVALVALLRHPRGWRGAGLAGVVAVLSVASAWAKSTAVVAALLMGGMGLLLWAGMLVAGWLSRLPTIRRRLSRRATALLVPCGLMVLCIASAVASLWLIYEPDDRAAGWESGGTPTTQATRQRISDAPDGQYVLALAPGQQAYQWVELQQVPHPPLTATLSLWARPLGTGATPPVAYLVVDQRGRLPVIGVDNLSAVRYSMPITRSGAGQWSLYTMTAPVRFDDRKVLVQLVAGDYPVQFDGLSLTAQAVGIGQGQGTTQQARQAPPGNWLSLFNPSAETGTMKMRPLISRLVPDEEESILSVLVNQQAYDRLAIARRFAFRQFRSFWGNFGWVSVPLPEAMYHLIEVVVVAALAGLGIAAIRRAGRWSWREWLGLLSLISLAGAVIMSWARQMAPAGGQGVFTDPFGRYLFPLMIPVLWLLLAGLGTAWSLAAHYGRKFSGRRAAIATTWLGLRMLAGARRGPVAGASYTPWGVWLWALALALFTAYCLLALIGPYYYSY